MKQQEAVQIINDRSSRTELLYRTVFRQSPDGILIIEEDGSFIDFNEAAHRQLGYTREEFARLRIADIDPVEGPEEIRTRMREILENGSAEFEVKHQTKDGEIRDTLVISQVMVLDGDIVFHNIWRDITESKRAQEAVRESLQKLQEEKDKTEAIIEAIGEGLSIRDPDFRILFQNQLHAETSGDHIGEICYEALHGRDKVCPGCPVTSSFKDGMIHRAERSVPTDKGIQHFEITSSPIRDSSGKIISAIELVRNITEKKRAEEALTEANAKLESLVNAIPDMVFFKDAQGRHLVVNKTVEKITGLPKESFLGKVCEEIFPPNIVRICRDSDENALCSLEPIHSEESTISAEGRTIFLDTIKAPIHGEGGNLLGLVAVSRDITERKLFEVALQESEKRFRAAVDNFPEVFVIYDAEQRLQYVNAAGRKLLNLPLDTFLGKRDDEIIPLEICSQWTPLLEQAIESCSVVSDEITLPLPTGLIVQNCTLVPLLDDQGKIFQILGIAQDITARKKIEEELQKTQKLESIGLLAGGIAHDFNNLLTVILGNIEVARMFLSPGEKSSERLSVAEQAAIRARGIARQLLTFAKGGAPIKKVVSVPQFVQESIDFALRGTRVRPAYKLPPHLWDAEIDETQINQVLSNLAINADQAMPEGGTLKVTVRNETLVRKNPTDLPEGRYIRIEIADQGIGIPQKYHGKIFDPYFTTKENGSGLGLSIAYSIIKRHGGAINVDSTFGQGTTFIIFLPATEKKQTGPPVEIKQEGP
ncbi:MAG: PAS domain S-box protein, partial [Deltaproteobacteria bacterium]